MACARLEHADTGALLHELTPTGPGAPLPALGLLLHKFQDAGTGVESFAYYGGIIPGLALPCGVPVRLVLDNAYQSPRFTGRADSATACLQLDWWHDSPLYRVPYGTGLHQRLYVENAGLQYAPTREKSEVIVNPATGEDTVVFMAKIRAATVSTEPLPAYLAEALSAANAHQRFAVDGEEWKLAEAKETKAGTDGGRDAFTLTFEQTDVLVRRSCPVPAPVSLPYAPDMVRPWRCGDTSDTAPDFQPDGEGICESDNDDLNTGYVLYTTRDVNPNSASFNQVGAPVRGEQPNEAQCPVPPLYYSAEVAGYTSRSDCAEGQASGEPVYYRLAAGAQTSRVSQAQANEAAQALYATQAQAHANATGTCLTAGPGGGAATYVPVYTPDGCFACQMANEADLSDVRDATAPEINQYTRAYNNNGTACAPCAN
ncbi:hypothetical protein BEN47_06195 [Hymenobacter lapidarius]|uniref:DUF5977 domain-containing protein n=1 Tax=Hymenobacter lapidarius TaxID=1908237 RepID=A0A1G1SQE3_9BACT|nr:DUF5977 domain-containing protein [Hymenobacter lapidarius]OGX80845.1 hypothetical protein BEN47_06195 [Hymenobacter lapidarius]